MDTFECKAENAHSALNLSSAKVAPKRFGKGGDLYPRSGPGWPSQQNIMALILPKYGS